MRRCLPSPIDSTESSRRRWHEDPRRGVADAVRLEPRELLRERERELANAGDRVDVHALLEVAVGEHGVDVRARTPR